MSKEDLIRKHYDLNYCAEKHIQNDEKLKNIDKFLLSELEATKKHVENALKAALASLDEAIAGLEGLPEVVYTHIDDFDNPHNVTKAQVGLDSVVNVGMDNVPTANSSNYVKSGGVHSSILSVANLASQNESDINNIESLIPSTATVHNQLADRDFVNSSINAIAAYPIQSNAQGDPFATKSALIGGAYYSAGRVRVPTRNDYAFVVYDESKDGKQTRYYYDGERWAFQYVVNDTPFTAEQNAAINSGITSQKISQYDAYATNKQDKIDSTHRVNGDYVDLYGEDIETYINEQIDLEKVTITVDM